MENEIKVGEYIRTINGEIATVIEFKDELILDKEIKFYGIYRSYLNDDELEHIVKHSNNIFDIIELGDIGKFYMEDDVDEEDTNWFEIIAKCEATKELGVMNKDYQADFFLIENLREILTKEMMESISYKVKQEEN